MQLRMLGRRSLNGSMTIVGDIAQATGAWAHDNWEEILEHLPDRAAAGPAGRADHRLPHPGAEHGARRPGARVAAPDLRRPRRCARTATRRRIVRAAGRERLARAAAVAPWSTSATPSAPATSP